MWDQDDSFREDHMAVGKGIAYGLLFGTLLWAGIIGSIWLWLK